MEDSGVEDVRSGFEDVRSEKSEHEPDDNTRIGEDVATAPSNESLPEQPDSESPRPHEADQGEQSLGSSKPEPQDLLPPQGSPNVFEKEESPPSPAESSSLHGIAELMAPTLDSLSQDAVISSVYIPPDFSFDEPQQPQETPPTSKYQDLLVPKSRSILELMSASLESLDSDPLLRAVSLRAVAPPILPSAAPSRPDSAAAPPPPARPAPPATPPPPPPPPPCVLSGRWRTGKGRGLGGGGRS